MQENTAVQETNSINQEQISLCRILCILYVPERLGDHLPFFSRRHFTVFCLLAVKTRDYLEKRERLLHGQHSAAGGIHLLHRRMGDHRSEQAGGVSVSNVSAAESIF